MQRHPRSHVAIASAYLFKAVHSPHPEDYLTKVSQNKYFHVNVRYFCAKR